MHELPRAEKTNRWSQTNDEYTAPRHHSGSPTGEWGPATSDPTPSHPSAWLQRLGLPSKRTAGTSQCCPPYLICAIPSRPGPREHLCGPPKESAGDGGAADSAEGWGTQPGLRPWDHLLGETHN